MKITRELIDNGRKIVHVEYEKKELEAMKKRRQEEEAKHKAELEKQDQPAEKPTEEQQA